MGGLIGAAIGAMLFSDLLAFYWIQGLFGYSYATSWKVFGVAFAYVFLAFLVSGTRERADGYRSRALASMHRLVSKWLWRLLFFLMLAIPVAELAAKLAVKESSRYVEVVGTWERQDTRVQYLGSDAYYHVISKTSPVLRDIQRGETFAAIDDSDEAHGYDLTRQRALHIRDGYFGVCPDRYVIEQARVRLESTLFGKHRITRVDYVPFDKLPAAIQENVIARLGSERGQVGPLWCLRKTHPEWREQINASLAVAAAWVAEDNLRLQRTREGK